MRYKHGRIPMIRPFSPPLQVSGMDLSVEPVPHHRRAQFLLTASGMWRRAYHNAYLLLTLTMMMWGANAVVARMASGAVSPMALVFLRWIMSLALLALIARRKVVLEWPILRQRWRFVLIMGFVGYTVTNAMYFFAAHLTTAVNLSILPGGIPIFVLLGVVLFHKTKIKFVQIAGVTLTIAGIVTIACKGHIETLLTLSFNPGDIMIVLNTMFYAAYTINLKNRPKVSSIVFFAGMAATAMVSSIPLVGIEGLTGHLQWPATGRGWFVVIYIGLFTSLISQLWFMRAVELIGPGRAGVFVNLVPVFGAFFAVVILGEPFHAFHAVALSMVLGGILLAESPVLRTMLRAPAPKLAE